MHVHLCSRANDKKRSAGGGREGKRSESERTVSIEVGVVRVTVGVSRRVSHRALLSFKAERERAHQLA
jgi:hypothetical protein